MTKHIVTYFKNTSGDRDICVPHGDLVMQAVATICSGALIGQPGPSCAVIGRDLPPGPWAGSRPWPGGQQ